MEYEKPMPRDEASRLKVLLQLFDTNRDYVGTASLKYALDSLSLYFASGWCGSFEYYKYRRRLTEEWAKRNHASAEPEALR